MKRAVQAGSTSQTEYVVIRDANGSPITGLVYNSTGLIAYYVLPLAASASIALATQTVTGAWATGGFVEIDSTHMPGLYRVDIPNACFASSNTHVVICLSGYSGMAQIYLEYDLWAVNPQDAVRFALTALPNATAGATGGLPEVDSSGAVKVQSGTGANQISLASGLVTVGTNNDKTGYSLATGQITVKKNTALAAFPFAMYNSAGAGVTLLTVTAQRRIDSAGSFSACTNAVTEISNGWYTIDLSAADLNGNTIALRFSATGALDTNYTIVTQA